MNCSLLYRIVSMISKNAALGTIQQDVYSKMIKISIEINWTKDVVRHNKI